MAKAIGILGGTFDPIHFGHLRSALDALEQLGLDRIHLVPNGKPPHREQPQASPEQRLTMVQLAIKYQPQLIADPREIKRMDPCYTIDTLASFREDYSNDRLYLIIGSDVFAQIDSWHRWDELLQFTHLVVMQRSDHTVNLPSHLIQWYQQHLAKDPSPQGIAGQIWPIRVTPLAISASAIRSKIAQGNKPYFLLPDAVIQFIEGLRLYTG